MSTQENQGILTRFPRLPTGEVELIAIDSVLVLAKAAMAWDIEPFEQAGWNSQADDGGVGCDKDFLGLPLADRDCYCSCMVTC